MSQGCEGSCSFRTGNKLIIKEKFSWLFDFMDHEVREANMVGFGQSVAEN